MVKGNDSTPAWASDYLTRIAVDPSGPAPTTPPTETAAITMKPVADLFLHTVAQSFPRMDPAHYADLRENIRQHGVREPLVLSEGLELVLDGRHRLEAARELGIEMVPTRVEPGDPLALAVLFNAYRRHLTPAQRAAAVELLWRADPAKAEQAKAEARAAKAAGRRRGTEPAAREVTGNPTEKPTTSVVRRKAAEAKTSPGTIKKLAKKSTEELREVVRGKTPTPRAAAPRPTPPAPAPRAVPAAKTPIGFQQAARVLQEFSENKQLQAGVRTTLGHARKWISAYPKYRASFHEFYAALAGAFEAK